MLVIVYVCPWDLKEKKAYHSVLVTLTKSVADICPEAWNKNCNATYETGNNENVTINSTQANSPLIFYEFPHKEISLLAFYFMKPGLIRTEKDSQSYMGIRTNIPPLYPKPNAFSPQDLYEYDRFRFRKWEEKLSSLSIRWKNWNMMIIPLTPFGIFRKSSIPKAFCVVLKVQWSVPTSCNMLDIT